MALLNPFGGYLTARGIENHPVWDGRKGRYEVWYLTFNAPEHQSAFWLRYTLEAPDHGEPFGELWGHFFDAQAPERSFGLRRRFPAEELKLGQDPLIRLGDAALFEGHAVGRLESAGRSLEWDVRFEPSPTAFFVAPRILRSFLQRKRTNWMVPNADVRYRGRMVVDGLELFLEHSRGQQAHIHGRQHALRWAWAHCNHFEGSEDSLLEGVAAELVLGGVRRLLTAVYVRHQGEHYLCNALPGALRNKSTLEFPSWKFHCVKGDVELRGEVRVPVERMLQVRYEDPDGTPSYCCNSELSDLEVEVRRGGRLVETLRAGGTAHLEFGQREQRPEVRLGHGS